MPTFTENAVIAVNRFLQNSTTGATGIRIQISDGGCAGLQYGMMLESVADEKDNVIETGGVKVFVSAESLPLVRGIIIDFEEGLESSGFTFANPNAKSSCSCGKSFSA
ncbi:HesB/IscA family protein [Candidatus Methylobacter oryzae]|uniref:Iron-sulfur cluster assembly accessory protein n=1 Tax=Candidatus Methylobacter oryzae TaxID=2497749 RepID=A0ABY3C5R1_9GAMM|nr:iron-sulfur cluster assembly accessory protein [Candidatus Methylobacter oryzae]TRW89630.1 iron-sulfur cluster assembly accessory protein [Candidatus Methylobacter oryzae]